MNTENLNRDKLDFEKLNGLLPAIILDEKNGRVLMLGFMNREAFEKTIDTGLVTFFSRSRDTLWTKGETSGNYLHVSRIESDCDNDTLLVYARPDGNTCHTGSYSCFAGVKDTPDTSGDKNKDFLYELFELIQGRQREMPEGSYTTKLFQRGENRIIQKVGEEAIETVIAAKNNDREEIINETADLFYHLFVMLTLRGIELSDVVDCLVKRHAK